MTIKKLFPYLFLLLSVITYGQNERLKEKRDQIKAMKVAFLTSELNLTSDEAEKFWPVYNAYDDKQFELRHQKMKTYARKLNDGSLNNMPEALILLSHFDRRTFCPLLLGIPYLPVVHESDAFFRLLILLPALYIYFSWFLSF